MATYDQTVEPRPDTPMARRWVTFDCYGTLVDWRSGMLACFADVAGEERAHLLLRSYHPHEAALEAGEFRTYRAVMAEAFRRAADDLGLRLTEAEAAALPESIARWSVFPEVPDALRRLRAQGQRLAVLSNIDDDLIAPTLAGIGVPFDAVVTAQQVRSYKPAAGHFDEFARRVHVEPGNWFHVGCSYFHDIEPCTLRGVVGIMVNRDGQPGPFPRAATVLPDLCELPEAVTGLSTPLDAT